MKPTSAELPTAVARARAPPEVPGVVSGRLANPTHVAQSVMQASVAVPALVGQNTSVVAAQSAATLGSQQVPSGSAPGGVDACAAMSFEPSPQVWSFAVTALPVHMVTSQQSAMSLATVKS